MCVCVYGFVIICVCVYDVCVCVDAFNKLQVNLISFYFRLVFLSYGSSGTIY